MVSIPYARPFLGRDDKMAVMRVLSSTFLTQGPEILKFEQTFAQRVGSRYAVACSSATSGLHLSAMALEMRPQDYWWTSPNTFCATADAALRCGAKVEFIDIEWGTYNMDLNLLEDRLKIAARNNWLPKVVVPVHFAGNPVDMELLDRLRRCYGFRVVEDAAHATGAELRGNRVGSCRWSDLCVFSFHAVKILTTGEGGMITTNSTRLYEKLLRLRTHGISRHPKHRPRLLKAPWYYEKLELGNHYRITDIQATLGRSQLKKLDQFLQERRRIACIYSQRLACTGWELPTITPGAEPSWHLYVVAVPVHRNWKFRDSALTVLRKKGIHANLHYTPVNKLAFYKNYLKKNDRPSVYSKCPVAERYGERGITLPIFPGLKPKDQHVVVRELLALGGGAQR